MIKKPTLIVLLCAAILGGVAYYFNWKQAKGAATPKDTTKPALAIQPVQVTAIMLTHPSDASSMPIRFERKGMTWTIVQPVATAADQSSVDGLVDTIAGARSQQTEPGTVDRKKAYGLDPARASIELTLRDGAKHTLLVGDKDFTGDSVYVIVDGGQNVLMLPAALGDNAAKSLDDLRDRSVLHIDTSKAASFELKNGSGALAASKMKDQWRFTKPGDSPAGSEAINELLSAVGNAKMVNIASETSDNLAKYGLANPAVALTVTNDDGSKATLLIGKKDGDDYDARDASRPTIFRINGDLFKKLAENYGDLRDKSVVQIDTSDIQKAELHSDAGVIAVSRKKDNNDEWVIDSPADQKGKTAASWKILDPIIALKAEEVIDHPPASVLAQLAKPDYTLVLTKKDGKDVTIHISKPLGDFVYAQTAAGPAVYKLKKQLVSGLSLKGSDVVL